MLRSARFILIFTATVVETVLSSAAADAPPLALAKLRDEHQKAKASALMQLNRTYATQCESVAKYYLTAKDLAMANQTTEFGAALVDADETNDLAGIAGTPSVTDRLGNLQAKYAREREEMLRKLNQSYVASAEALQQQFMRSNDLGGANAAAELVKELKPAAAPGAVSASLTAGRPLLSKESERKWKRLSGEWKIEPGVLTGSGDSSIVCDDALSPPFTLRFTINVRDGLRPRVRIGPVSFANEGYSTVFGLYPGGEEPKTFNYQRNKDYKVAIAVSRKKTEMYVDEKLIATAPGVKDRIEGLEFRAGDGWSKGRVEYRDIVVVK